ncbi:MAG TPA: fumarylacetoacetate hydrolase family protein [Stellaceae bacterium]|nr:fumarylacetoacetate hydrolase family protein [Stellaceae bacterium]
MRLSSIISGGVNTVAARRDGRLYDLRKLEPDLPDGLDRVIMGGQLDRALRLAAKVDASAEIDPAKVKYRPLIERPGKIICIGRNYAAHAREGGVEPPTYPEVFFRGPTSLAAHESGLLRPKCSDKFDYEAELVVVIGKTAKHVRAADALDVVAGYSICNEGTIRDYQRKSSQWTIGKNFDRTGALGPEMVTPDELPAGAKGLRIMTRLNGQVLQDDNTDNMIFSVPVLIEHLTECLTLEAGDVIISGTPQGVGYARKPPVFMKAGDTVEIEIPPIGILRNTIVDE